MIRCRYLLKWRTVCGYRIRAHVFPNQQGKFTIPIVLVHGLGASGRYMLPLAARLSRQYDVHVLDLPGFGASDKPPHALRVHALADILSNWLEASGQGHAVLLGNSLGCQVIVDLTVRHPKQVHSAILVGPTVDRLGHTMPRQLWRGICALLREPLALWPILARDYWSSGTKRLFHTFRFALEDPVREKFSQIRVPTLVVRGGRDPIAPQRWVEEVVALIPCGRLLVIPDGTHATNYSSPDELADAVADFLVNYS